MTIGAGRTAMLRYGVAASVEHVKVLSGLVCRHVVDIGANCVGNRGQCGEQGSGLASRILVCNMAAWQGHYELNMKVLFIM